MNRTFLAVIMSAVAAVCGYAQKVDNSLLIPGMTVVTQEQDLVAMAAISALTTQSFARVYDSAQPSRYFMEVVNGTGTVYEVTGPHTNLMVTLSDDFEETATHSRPAWTTNAFPFTDGSLIGEIYGDGNGIAIHREAPDAVWLSETYSYPSTLIPVSGYSQGSATVSVSSVYYTTNAIKHLTSESELEEAKAACAVVLTNTVASATNALMPYTRTVYGDVSTTNETGYAAFNATNAGAVSYSSLTPSSAVGSFTNTFRYYLNDVRKTGVLTNKAWFVKSGFGVGYKIPSTRLSVKDAAGNTVASSYVSGAAIDQTVSTFVCVTNSFALPLNVYSGTVEVACIVVSTNASFSVRLYTGGQYASSLSFGEAPIPYATVVDVSGLKLGGATNITDGVTSGTFIESTRTFDISAITKKITKPILSSATNIVVASTNAVYYVALTNAANVGFDFSALALGGTNRADITAIIDCLNTQALYSVLVTNALTMDCLWEPTVTGRYEIAISSDGIRTTARQVWPKNDTPQLAYAKYNYAGTAATMPDSVTIAEGATNGAVYTWVACPDCWYAVRAQFSGGNEGDTVTVGYYRIVSGYADYTSSFISGTVINPGSPYGWTSGWVIVPPPSTAWLAGPGFANGVGIWVTRSGSTSVILCRSFEVRKANALEIKAAQALGY